MKKTLITASISTLSILSTAAVVPPIKSVAFAASYNPQVKRIVLNGQLINRPYGIVSNNTTYMPIWYVMQALDKLNIKNAWNGTTWTLTAPSTIPVNLTSPPTTHGNKTITLNGKALYHVNRIAYADPASHVVTTYMPIWYIQQLLDRLSIHSTWDGHTWALTTQPPSTTVSDPSQPGSGTSGNPGSPSTPVTSPTPPKRVVITWVNSANSISDAVQQTNLTEINNDNYDFTPDGSIQDTTNGGSSTMSNLLAYGHSHNVNLFMTVANTDPTTWNFSAPYTEKVLSDNTTRTNLEKSLVSTAVQDGYAGVDVDFESLKQTDRSIFTQFLSELAQRLHASNKQLSVTLPAETSSTPNSWAGAYDYTSIGAIADRVPIMTYDFSWPTSKPGAVAPLYWDEQVMKYATSVIPAGKVIMGIAAYGYDWNTTTGAKATACSMARIDALIQQYKVTPSWDATDSVPYFTYTDSTNHSHSVYYDNQTSIEMKLSVADKYGIAGICFWKSGLENQSFWKAVVPWLTSSATQAHS